MPPGPGVLLLQPTIASRRMPIVVRIGASKLFRQGDRETRRKKQSALLCALPVSLSAGLPVSLSICPLALAQNPMKDNIQNVLGLLVRRLGAAGEVIGKHGAVAQIAEDVGDAL